MSEEEKKAIENIVHIIQYWKPPKEDELATFEYESIRKLYEIYNKEKEKNKELEVLKDSYSDDKIRNTVIKRFREVIEQDYISKDKIKEKIKELEQIKNTALTERTIDMMNDKIIVLEQLLEE